METENAGPHISGSITVSTGKSYEYGAGKKLVSTIITMLIFFAVNMPVTYKLVDKLFGGKNFIVNVYGCPTWAGVAIHTVVFGLILYLVMAPWKKATCTS